MRTWALGVALCLVACGGTGESDKSTSEASKASGEDRPATSGQRSAAPSGQADSPAKAEMREIYVPPDEYWAGFFRAPGGTSVVVLPPISGTWTYVRNESGMLRVLQIFHGTPASYDGNLTVFFYPRAEATVRAEDVVGQLVQSMKAKAPFLSDVGQVESGASEGGTTSRARLAGTNPKGASEVVVIAALADGRDSIGIVLDANSDAAAAAEELMGKLLQSARVGGHVPRLAPNDPGTPLDGIYAGLYSDRQPVFYVFDRGHLSTAIPGSLSDLDLEATLQRGGKLQRYAVKGDQLEVTPESGKSYMLPLQIMENALQIDDWHYISMSASRTNGMALDGHFQNKTSSSSTGPYDVSVSSSDDYYFSPDGGFSTRSSTAITGDVAGTDSARTTGKYRVHDHLLSLTFADGSKVDHLFFPAVNGKDLDLSRGIYIDGTKYFRRDD